MKSLNRTLSLVLVLVMVLGLIGVAGAADFKDKADIKNDEAVNTMAALNIIKGKDTGNFDPTGSVTRGEMAKMICVALNGGKEPVLGTTTTPTYSDTVGHWAAGYIEYCTASGIVAGTGNGAFAPNAPVTGSQAAKMMLVAMNYDATVFGFTGANWENTVNTEANKAGLYENLSIDASAALSRDNAAQLIYNGINAKTMKIEWKSDGTKTYTATGATIAADKFKLYTNYGTMIDASYNTIDKVYKFDFDNKDVNIANEYADLSNTSATTFETGNVDYSAYYGMQVKLLWTVNAKGDTIVYGVYPYKSDVLLSGVLGQLSDATWNTADIKFNGVTYKFDANLSATPVFKYGTATTDGAGVAAAGDSKVDTYYNSVNAGFVTKFQGTVNAATAPAAYIFKGIDKDGDGKIDLVVVYPYAVAKVSYVGSDYVRLNYKVDTAYAATNLDKEDIIAYDGIAKGDFVKVTDADHNSKATTTVEKVTVSNGKVTAVAADATKATIGGFALGNLVKANVGTTYDYVMVNGFIWNAEVTATTASANDYAVVKDTADDVYGTHTAKLLFSDGTSKQVETDILYTLLEDYLVTYEKDSSDEYTLTKVTTKGDFERVALGDDASLGGADIAFNAKKDTLGGNPIADDAVIFVKKTKGGTADGYKVITGKQLKDTSAIDTTFAKAVLLGNVNSTTGYATVLAAYVCIDSTVATTGDTQYGYVTQGLVTTKNTDGDKVSSITFWDGSAEVTKLATDDVSNIITKGSIFSYTMDGEDIVVSLIPALKLSYISSVDGDKLAINGCADDEISDDTVVMYIDSENHKGYAEGDLDVADGTTANVYYVENDADDDFVLVVYDVNNEMTAATKFTASSSITDVQANDLLALYSEVTVGGSITGTSEGVQVPAGKTLKVAGDIDKVTSNAGTIIMGSDTATITTLTANTGAIVVAGAKLTITNAVGTSAYLQGVVAFAAGVQLDIKADTTAGTGYDADKDAATFSVTDVAVADDAKVLANVYTAVGTLNDTVWTVA